jgi:peptidoglycan hydrolase-like protein with peptidoglycan-binding domain
MRLPSMAGSAFFLIGLAIVGNALFMQPARHPAPLFDEPIPAATQVRPDELVRAVQAALIDAGYYSGAADGLAGPKTEAAIRAFEAASGRIETGQATAELLVAILSVEDEGSQAADAAPVAEPPAAEPDPQVAAIQRALADAAYGPLATDGVYGAATRNAIMRFQKDRGLEMTGEISDTLVVELRAAGALIDE